MAPKSVSGSKGKKPLIVSSPTKKRKSSIPEGSSGENDVKTLLSQILGSVGELHQKTDLISERLVLLEEKVKEQKKKEIIFIKQWVGEKENEGKGEDEDEAEEEGAQENREEDEENKVEDEENKEEDAGEDMEKEQDEGDDGNEADEEEEEGEKEAATEFSSEAESNLPALSKGHRYGLRSRSSAKFSNTADQPIILTPSSSSAASNP